VGIVLLRGLDLIVFGHQVPIAFDPVTSALIVLVLVGISMASEVVLLRGALRRRPTESIREALATEPPQSLEAILRG